MHCQRDADLVLKVAVVEGPSPSPGRAGTGRRPGGQGALGRFSRCVPGEETDAIEGQGRRRAGERVGEAWTVLHLRQHRQAPRIRDFLGSKPEKAPKCFSELGV